MSTLIRYLSAGYNGGLFAAAEFERQVHIFRTGYPSPIFSLDTVMDFGGNRLQIIPELDILIAGAYERQGIEAYALSSGNILWARRDLKRVQNIRFCPNTGLVSCLFESRSGLVLVPETGDEAARYRGVKDIYFSTFGSEKIEEAKPYRLLNSKGETRRIVPQSFAILDVSFGKHTFAMSEAGSFVRIFDSTDASECGCYRPQQGSHILSLFYMPKTDLFGAIEWPYEDGGPTDLLHLDKAGHVVFRTEIENGHSACSLSDRDSILTLDGGEYSWTDGKKFFQYSFPPK